MSTINKERGDENEIMVPFNEESLFTNAPIEGAVQAMLQKLDSDPCLADCTTLTPTQTADLLNFFSRSTYFQYDRAIYKLQDGAAMGSSVSTVIAKLYTEDFEEQALLSAPTAPKFWKYYVGDDILIDNWTISYL